MRQRARRIWRKRRVCVHRVGALQREDGRCVVVVAQLGQSRSGLGCVKLALLDCPLLFLPQLVILLLNRLLDLLTDNALQTRLYLAAAVVGQTAVGLGNVVPQEEDVEDDGNNQTQGSNDPDNQGEQHGKVDDCFLPVTRVNHGLDIDEELLNVGTVFGSMVASGNDLGLHDGVQRHGVDCDSGALGDKDEQGALELEVDEKRNVVDALFTLCQLGKNQETAPALARRRDAHTLPDDSHGLEVALGHASGAHDAQGADVAVDEKNIGNDDGDGEDPLCDFKGHGGLDGAGPLVKGEKVDGSKGVGGVDGARNDDEDPQPGIGKGREARSRLEVGEGLATLVWPCLLVPPRSYNVRPLLLLGHTDGLFAIPTAAHGGWFWELGAMYVMSVCMYPVNGTRVCSPAVGRRSGFGG